MTVARHVALWLIRLYRRLVSPLLPGCCRFEPSCSAYAAGVIEKHGLVRGLPRAALRLLKCQPLHPGGYDPVR